MAICIDKIAVSGSKTVLELCEGIWFDEGIRGVFEGYFAPNDIPVDKMIRHTEYFYS